jgi:SAM-dependent methyltransferase
MSSFPLLTTDELEAARARWDTRGPGTAAAGLHENLESVLADPAFESPLHLGLASNLFQVQGLLLDGALAFRLGGEERHLEPVRNCIASIAQEHVRRARLPSEVHLAFVVVGLVIAHELCGEAIDRDLVEHTVAAIVAELHGASLREEWGDRIPKRNAWNHTAVAYAAIGCGGLLCRERDPRAELWLRDALERVRLFFADGVTDAGMTREGLAYCGFVFRNLAPLLLACRNANVWDYRSPQDNPHVERLRRVPRWYAIEAFPGGSWLQPINDSYWSPRRAMGGFLPAFGALDPPLTAWVYDVLFGARGDGTHGRDRSMSASSLFESVLWGPAETPLGSAVDLPGVPATQRQAVNLPGVLATQGQAVDLPEVLADSVVGYLAERVRETPRSGFSLNCGEYLGGIHDQSDNGSVTLFAGNVPVLIDSSAANNPVEGSASSSHGHNVVLVDGRGQFPSGGGAGCTGKIVHVEHHAQATTVTVDLTTAYDARAHNPVERAIRHCVFGKRPFTYLLVVDDFSRPHSEEAVYEQLFHTPPPIAESVRVGGDVQMRIEFEGASCTAAIRPLDGAATVVERFFAQHDLSLFPKHNVWCLRRAGAHMVMPTLVLAHDGEGLPEVRSAFDRRAGRVTLEWEAAGQTGVDVLQFAPGSAEAATLTRNGERLPGAERLLTPSVQDAAAHSVDERALVRRRRLRRLVESVDAFDSDEALHCPSPSLDMHNWPGRELLEHFVALAELDPDASVLDLECGMGHHAAPLIHYLRWGSYVGFDSCEESIAWCRSELAPRNPRFQFEHLDARLPAPTTRRHGLRSRPSSPRLPSQDECFDFVIATSLLASVELDGEGAAGCLRELTRVLRDDGAIFLTTSLSGDRGGGAPGGDGAANGGSAALDWLSRDLPAVAGGKTKLVVDRAAPGALANLSPQVGPDILVLRRTR